MYIHGASRLRRARKSNPVFPRFLAFRDSPSGQRCCKMERLDTEATVTASAATLTRQGERNATQEGRTHTDSLPPLWSCHTYSDTCVSLALVFNTDLGPTWTCPCGPFLQSPPVSCFSRAYRICSARAVTCLIFAVVVHVGGCRKEHSGAGPLE